MFQFLNINKLEHYLKIKNWRLEIQTLDLDFDLDLMFFTLRYCLYLKVAWVR